MISFEFNLNDGPVFEVETLSQAGIRDHFDHVDVPGQVRDKNRTWNRSRRRLEGRLECGCSTKGNPIPEEPSDSMRFKGANIHFGGCLAVFV